jgi:hypothetical protein
MTCSASAAEARHNHGPAWAAATRRDVFLTKSLRLVIRDIFFSPCFLLCFRQVPDAEMMGLYIEAMPQVKLVRPESMHPGIQVQLLAT